MTSPPKRRPLPALVFLVALTLLTALVWWRVLNRDDSQAAGGPSCPSTAATGATASRELPHPAQVHVTVLNSTNRNGLAHSVTKALGKDGFTIDKTDNDTGPVIKGVGEIRYLPRAHSEAILLSYYVPGAKLVRVTSTSATTPALVVSLGKAYKKLATPKAVRAQLRADNRSLAPTTTPATTPATTATRSATRGWSASTSPSPHTTC